MVPLKSVKCSLHFIWERSDRSSLHNKLIYVCTFTHTTFDELTRTDQTSGFAKIYPLATDRVYFNTHCQLEQRLRLPRRWAWASLNPWLLFHLTTLRTDTKVSTFFKSFFHILQKEKVDTWFINVHQESTDSGWQSKKSVRNGDKQVNKMQNSAKLFEITNDLLKSTVFVQIMHALCIRFFHKCHLSSIPTCFIHQIRTLCTSEGKHFYK